MAEIVDSQVSVDWLNGHLTGTPIRSKQKRLGELNGLFRDREAFLRMDPGEVVYSVQYWMPVSEGAVGGLFWGNTTLEPGLVGDEFFMTAGHLHAQVDRAEFYATVGGEGLLLLMDASGSTRAVRMSAGSVHYVPGGFAHRVVNTGRARLTFLACWPSDAGHDYETVASRGFGVRVRLVDGCPRVLEEAR